MKKRRNHDAGFKARVALEAVKGERTVSDLATEYGVHPTMIHQWKKALLDGAADIFERGGKKAPEVDEDPLGRGRLIVAAGLGMERQAVGADGPTSAPERHGRITSCSTSNGPVCGDQIAIGRISSGPAARLEFTATPTRCGRVNTPSAEAFISTAAPCPASPSQRGQSARSRTTASR